MQGKAGYSLCVCVSMDLRWGGTRAHPEEVVSGWEVEGRGHSELGWSVSPLVILTKVKRGVSESLQGPFPTGPARRDLACKFAGAA